MKYFLSGGSWISAAGYGTLQSGDAPLFPPGEMQLPPADQIFHTPLRRYGRFDLFTRLGCAAVGLALIDADAATPEGKRDIGIVMATRLGSFVTDLAYHTSTLEENGAYASPSLFSYTLPGIVLGECAAHFGLTGPTFCVGDSGGTERGLPALHTAVSLLQAGATTRVIAGWLDTPCPAVEHNSSEQQGAAFVVITAGDIPLATSEISLAADEVFLGTKPIHSISDLWLVDK